MADTSIREENDVHDSESALQAEIEQLRQGHVTRKKRGYRILAAAVFLYALAVSLFISAFLVGLYITFQIKAAQLAPRIAEAVPFILESHVEEVGEYVAHFMIVSSMIPFCFASKLAFIARRYFKQDARLAVLEDTRTPVLYLRSFSDDETQNPAFGVKWNSEEKFVTFKRFRDEELLVKELARCVGPVIAIGRPGELLPELGAYRFHVTADMWKDEIRRRMKCSRLVLLRTATTDGVRWELEQLLELVSPDRIVLHSPNRSIPECIQALVEERLGTQLGTSAFVAFDSLGNAAACDTIQRVLEIHSIYVQKGRIARLFDLMIRGESLARIVFLLLYIAVAALPSYLIVLILDLPSLVFWPTWFFLSVLLARISFRLPTGFQRKV